MEAAMPVEIEGVNLHLAHPDELAVQWVGQDELMRQLLAAWMVVHEADLPMNPRLLDNRRYVESIVAGIKIKAHAHFRLVATMNDDASTFELPEYIHSRLQPQIFIDFPERDEEYHILKENLPFAEDRILQYVTDFLQLAHAADERYTVRDGINVARYAIKLKSLATQRTHETEALEIAVVQVLGEEALRYARRDRSSVS